LNAELDAANACSGWNACAAVSIALSFTFDINTLPCLAMEQFFCQTATISGEIVLSLAQ
jgi:hypothetical protein